MKRWPTLTLKTALKRAPQLYLILPAILLFVGAQLLLKQYPALSWEMPLWLSYYYTALIWGGIMSVFAFGFSVTVYIAFASRHVRRWSLGLCSLALLGAIELIQREYTRPIGPELKEQERDGVVLQSSGVSCASASAANLLRAFGIRKTEREMAGLFGASVAGATDAQVIYGMRKLRIRCERVEAPSDDISAIGAPAILAIDNAATGPESHAVLFAGYARDKVVILDPLVGKRVLTREMLARQWSGKAIRCERPAQL